MVFIDLDGTLADSMPLLYKLYLNVMKSLSLEGSKEEFQRLVGPSIKEISEEMIKHHNLTLSAENLAAQYHAKLKKLYQQVPLSEGVFEFLDFAKGEDLRLAIVTSAEKDLAEEFIENHAISAYFEQIFTSEGLEHSKPHPAIYKRALKEMGVEAGEALAIEDSQTGITSSRAAGIETLPFSPNSWRSIIDFIKKNW